MFGRCWLIPFPLPPSPGARAAGSLVFFRNLLNASPSDWDMLLYNGLKVDGVRAQRLTGVCVRV